MSTGSHSFQDIHLQISVDQLRGVERMRTQLELNRIRVKLCAYDIYGSTSFSPQMGCPRTGEILCRRAMASIDQQIRAGHEGCAIAKHIYRRRFEVLWSSQAT